jgi:TRAP-type C4-dicarboxylate transport system substrate-binding protein
MKRFSGKLYFVLALVLVTFILMSACSQSASTPATSSSTAAPPPSTPEKVYTIRFATDGMPPEPTATIPQELVNVIPERTNGRVKFEVYLGGELYGDQDAPAQLQAGALEMCWVGFNAASVSPGWDALAGCPFLVEDYDHYLRFQKTDAWKTMIGNLDAKGIKTIAEASDPVFAEIFNSVRPIKTLDDFKGLKIRIPPMPGLIALYQVLGIQNVTIASPEVPTALQTGMIDGVQTPIMTLKANNLAVNTPYVTRVNLSFTGATFGASAKFWDSLPPDLQQTLQQIFVEYGQKRHQGAVVLTDKLWKQYEDTPGTVVTTLSKEEKAKWVEAGKAAWAALASKSDEERMVIEAVDAIR